MKSDSHPCTPYQKRSGWVFQAGRTAAPGIGYDADGSLADGLTGLSKAQRRGTEERRLGLGGQSRQRVDIAQGSSHGFINIKRFASGEHGHGLNDMRPSIDAEQHHRIDSRAQILDRVYDLDAVLFSQGGGVAFDPGDAGFDVWTPSLERRHDLGSNHMTLGGGIVQDLGEGRGV